MSITIVIVTVLFELLLLVLWWQIWQLLSVTNEQDKICARIYATNEQIISPEKKLDERTLYRVR